MKNLIQFPAKYMIALELFAAKRGEVRYYLQTIAIQAGARRLVTTDGHRLMALPFDKNVENVDMDVDLLIPIETVANLRKKLRAKQKRESTIVVQDMGQEAMPRYRLLCEGETEAFQAIDADYPLIDRVIPDKSDCNGSLPDDHTFNWHYVADFQTAADILTEKKRDEFGSNVKLMPNKNQTGAARLEITAFPDVVAVVMPKRL